MLACRFLCGGDDRDDDDDDSNDDCDDDDAGSEQTRRAVCGQGAGLCLSAMRCSEQTTTARVPTIRESVFWSRFCCANALLLVSINIFLYAYFA